MAKLPALQFYPGDWKKDPGIQSLEFFDRAVWFELLLLMHDSSERGALVLNGKPMSEAAIARSIGLDKQILTYALTNILDAGVATRREDGTVINRRMIRDEQIRQERIKAGHLGGNPNLLKQNSTPQVNQNSTPSSSSSSSSSINNTYTLPINNLASSEEISDPNLEKWLPKASEHLPLPTDPPQKWQLDNRFINAGRRPMKKYPLIFISATELAEVFRQYDEVGLQPIDARQAFQAVAGRLLTHAANGSSNNQVSAFNWLIGWAKQEVLETAIKDERHKNAKEGYAKQSRR